MTVLADREACGACDVSRRLHERLGDARRAGQFIFVGEAGVGNDVVARLHEQGGKACRSEYGVTPCSPLALHAGSNVRERRRR
ncbi:MAG: hypothetical protein M3321_02210 [Actinomycetota bacterium]|nr:hypothetical protein [Actinomycetota bacterium]